MSAAVTIATVRRVLGQLRHDPRTIVLALAVPSLLMVLLRYMFASALVFDRIAPALLGLFPFLVMFLITSIGTLRERTSGTLERLMTMPIGRLDLLLGYALAFSVLAVAQVAVVATLSLTWLGLDVAGSLGMLLLIAVLDALLGTALGLFASAFARTEFQAVQFLPLVAFPQILLCGLFVPRGSMAWPLERLSDLMPLSYAVDGMRRVTASAGVTGDLARDVAVLVGCTVAALLLGAVTLRRRSA